MGVEEEKHGGEFVLLPLLSNILLYFVHYCALGNMYGLITQVLCFTDTY